MEQLHKIYKLCGSPSDEYWKKSKMPNATLFKPRHPYKRCITETFKDFPPSALPLIDTLLAIDPAERKSATNALRSEVGFWKFLICYRYYHFMLLIDLLDTDLFSVYIDCLKHALYTLSWNIQNNLHVELLEGQWLACDVLLLTQKGGERGSSASCLWYLTPKSVHECCKLLL